MGITRNKKYAIIPFMNTPAGLKVYPIANLNEVKKRCELISSLLIAPGTDIIEGNGRHVSVLTNRAVFTNNYKSVNHTLLLISFDKNFFEYKRVYAELQIDFKLIGSGPKIYYRIDEEKIFEYKDLFFYKHIGWIAFKRNLKDLNVKVDGDLYLSELSHNRLTHRVFNN